MAEEKGTRILLQTKQGDCLRLITWPTHHLLVVTKVTDTQLLCFNIQSGENEALTINSDRTLMRKSVIGEMVTVDEICIFPREKVQKVSAETQRTLDTRATKAKEAYLREERAAKDYGKAIAELLPQVPA